MRFVCSICGKVYNDAGTCIIHEDEHKDKDFSESAMDTSFRMWELYIELTSLIGSNVRMTDIEYNRYRKAADCLSKVLTRYTTDVYAAETKDERERRLQDVKQLLEELYGKN